MASSQGEAERKRAASMESSRLGAGSGWSKDVDGS
jgi:hypothetical protein